MMLILFLHHFICVSSEDFGNNRTEIECLCIIIASLLFISIFSQQSNPHAYSMCHGQSKVLSRQRARVRGEVLPASSELFVGSSLMKMGIVLNYITQHKAVLQMKTFCAHINYTFLYHNIASIFC